VTGQLRAPAALPPGKEPPSPIGWEAEWASEQPKELVYSILTDNMNSRHARDVLRRIFRHYKKLIAV